MRDEPPALHDPIGVVITALRTACPSFEPAWARHLSDWVDDEEGRGAYLDCSAFANHLVILLERGQTEEFVAVFDALERLYAAHDAGAHDLLTVGLLEAIQNIAMNRQTPGLAARFRPWLGATATAEWNELHQLWGTADE